MSKIDLDNFNIATASRPELKYFAFEKYGIKLSMSMTEHTMREKIQEHCSKNDLDQPVARVAPKKGKAKFKYHTVNIPKSDKPGGDEPVFVGFNGVGYSVPRGINVEVPEPIVEILRNAVTDMVTQDEDGLMHHSDVPTVPFTDLGVAASH